MWVPTQMPRSRWSYQAEAWDLHLTSLPGETCSQTDPSGGTSTSPGKLTLGFCTDAGKGGSRQQLCSERGEWSRPHPDLTHLILLLPPLFPQLKHG